MERKEAVKLGMKRYNTGRPCKNGHLPIRYTKTGICVGCQQRQAANYQRKVSRDIAARLSQHVELNMIVHRDSYQSIVETITALNDLMGIPRILNAGVATYGPVAPRPPVVSPVQDQIDLAARFNRERAENTARAKAAALASADAFGRPVVVPDDKVF